MCSQVSQEGMNWFHCVVAQSTRLLIVWILLFLKDWIFIYSLKKRSATEVHIVATMQDIGHISKRQLNWGVVSSLTRGFFVIPSHRGSIKEIFHILIAIISQGLDFYLQCEKEEWYRGAHCCSNARYSPTLLEEVGLMFVIKSHKRICPGDNLSCSYFWLLIWIDFLNKILGVLVF